MFPDPNNDADMLMVELGNDARDLANGVCPTCDEALEPLHPKWAGTYSERYTAESAAAHVGPHSNVVEGYHDGCLNDDHLY